MKHLKKLAEQINKKPIKALLNACVGGYESARSKKQIHASDLTKDKEYCPREHRLMELLEVKYQNQYISTALRVTFDDGVDKQRRINNDYLKDRMVGPWLCIRCGTEIPWEKGSVLEKETKGKGYCHADMDCVWEYKEPFFKHPSGAQGSVDALVDVGKDKLRLLEVKIMGNSMFPPAAPLAEHKWRTALYLRIIAESDHPHKDEINTDEASVLYVLRGHGRKDENGEISPFREFTVKRDDALVEQEIRKAQTLTYSRIQKPNVIPCGVCVHSMGPRAIACKVSKQCFSGDYPGNVTWDAKKHPEAMMIAAGTEYG